MSFLYESETRNEKCFLSQVEGKMLQSDFAINGNKINRVGVYMYLKQTSDICILINKSFAFLG